MSIFKEANWSDGQAVDLIELNNMSKWLRSQIFDTLSALARVDPWDVAPAVDTYLWSVGNGGAPYPNATGLTIKNLAGPIAHKITAGVDGSDAHFPVYYLAADELQTTFAAADPTNPRIDVVAIKLDHNPDTSVTRDFMSVGGVLSSQSFNSSRSVRVTKTVVTGTPAGSPVEPSIPASYVRFCAVKIPAAATNLAAIDVYDHRVPVGFRVVDIAAHQATYDESKWTWGGVGSRQHAGTSDPSAAEMYFWIPTGPHTRVIGVQLLSLLNNGSQGSRVAETLRFNAPGTATVIETLTSTLLAAVGGGAEFRGATPANPLWGDGTFGGYANKHAAPPITGGITTINRGALRIKASATGGDQEIVYLARFLVCG